MDWLNVVTGIAGGIGLFLLGMRLMTDGLRTAAGHALRRILERWTATRLRALLSGVLITSIVQSSSAVTVAVIGFANAGLLSLEQSVAVIYGSNIGTTVTGWLVALVGINVDVKASALPAIGLGMMLRLIGGRRKLGPLGEAIAGFGLFFLGIDILKGAMDGLQAQLPMSELTVPGLPGMLLLTLAGFALTVLMQSSSAAIAIILTSVAGEVVPIESGACLVVGANIGTTSTAAVAVLGATSNAKRVAMAHVAFNMITGLVAVATLPLLLFLVGRFRQTLGLEAQPAAVVAAFHTLFNLLGVVLMWPLTNRLVAFLGTRFRTRDEEEGRAQYLDRNVLSTPVLAVSALGLELARMGSITGQMAKESLRPRSNPIALERRREAVERLVTATGEFVTELQRQRLSEDVGQDLPVALRIARYYAEAAELAHAISISTQSIEAVPPEWSARILSFEKTVTPLLERTSVEIDDTAGISLEQVLAEAEDAYAALKDALLRAGVAGQIPVTILAAHLDRLSNVRRLAEQMERGARYLRKLEDSIRGEEDDLDEVEGGSPPALTASERAADSNERSPG